MEATFLSGPRAGACARRVLLALVLVGGFVAKLSPAHAQESESDATAFVPRFEASSYFGDVGAVAFVYLPLATTLTLRFFASPPANPLLFSDNEGGLEDPGNTVPELALGAYGFAAAGLIAALPIERRWHHVKGYVQAVLSTVALTEIAKNTFGRRRPIYLDENDVYQRRSFFSGHASVATSTTLYLGLYLHEHVLPRLRGPWSTPLRVATYAGLGAVYLGVPYSRLVDNQHHLSDVLTGAVVGSTMAVLFYAWQERRFLQEEEDFYARRRGQTLLERVRVLPDLSNRGLSLYLSF